MFSKLPLFGLAVFGALALPACADECGDGEYRDGEICLQDQAQELSPGLEGPLALRAADFDGDAHDDILVIGAGAAGVTGALRLGDGTGQLSAPRDAQVGGCSAYPVAADLDADGATDLFFATCTESLLYYRSEGGTFLAPLEIPAGALVRTCMVLDISGDGVRDLLILGEVAGAPVLSLVAATPTGFAAPLLTQIVPPGLTGFNPTIMAAGPLRRDGPATIVLGHLAKSGGIALATAASGLISPPQALATALHPDAFVLRDLDDDDTLDLLVLDRSRRLLAPLLGPHLAEGTRTDLGGDPRALALAHLDGDGSLDAVLIEGVRVRLWRGIGDGRFIHNQDLSFPGDAFELGLPDLNSDGRADLVAGPFAAGDVLIHLSGP